MADPGEHLEFYAQAACDECRSALYAVDHLFDVLDRIAELEEEAKAIKARTRTSAMDPEEMGLHPAEGMKLRQERYNEQRRLTPNLWFYIDAFLVAATRIDRLLWPEEGQWKTKALMPDRGEVLRSAMTLPDTSPLAARRLRNDLDHFDQRIDEWIEFSPSHNLIDRTLGTLTVAGSHSAFRAFDPGAAIASFGSWESSTGPRANTVDIRQETVTIEEIWEKAFDLFVDAINPMPTGEGLPPEARQALIAGMPAWRAQSKESMAATMGGPVRVSGRWRGGS